MAFTCLRSRKEKRIIALGIKRIDREFEVNRLLKGLIKIRIALKTLFTKAEGYLIRNNKVFVLDSD